MTLDQLIVGIVMLLFVFLLEKMGGTFKKFVQSIIDSNNNVKVQESINLVQETVNSVVVYLNTTTVDKIKEASKDGKLTKEEATAVFNEAKREIKKILTGDTLQLVSKVIGDVDAWIDVLIEKFVSENK